MRHKLKVAVSICLLFRALAGCSSSFAATSKVQNPLRQAGKSAHTTADRRLRPSYQLSEQAIQAALTMLELARTPGVPNSRLEIRRRAVEHFLRNGLDANRLKLSKTFEVPELMPFLLRLKARLERERPEILDNYVSWEMKFDSAANKATARRKGERRLEALMARIDAIERTKKLYYFDLLEIAEQGTFLRSLDTTRVREMTKSYASSLAFRFPFQLEIPTFSRISKKGINGDVASSVFRVALTDEKIEWIDRINYDRYGTLLHDEGHAFGDLQNIYNRLNWRPRSFSTPIPLKVFIRWLALLLERASIYGRVRNFVDRIPAPGDRWYSEAMWFFWAHELESGTPAYNPEVYTNHDDDWYLGRFNTQLALGLFGSKKPPVPKTSPKMLCSRLLSAAYKP